MPHNRFGPDSYYARYYASLVGATIQGTVMVDDGTRTPIPVLLVRLKGESTIREVSVLRDPEGNGGGHLADLPEPPRK